MLYKALQGLNNCGLCHHFVSKGVYLYNFVRMNDSIFLPVGIEELSFKRQWLFSFIVYMGNTTYFSWL